VWPWSENSPKFGAPYNIYALAETSDFKFGTQVGFAIRLSYNHTNDKSSLQNLAFLFNIFAMKGFAVAVPNKQYY